MHEPNQLWLQNGIHEVRVVKERADSCISFLQIQLAIIIYNYRDAMLLTWTMQGSPFNVAKIMHSTVLRYMYQANASACPALINSAIYFEHGVLKLPSDTLLCRMEPLFDTAT